MHAESIWWSLARHCALTAMRSRRNAIAVLLALVIPYAESQAQELLASVDAGSALRLSEYNSAFLTKELYFASRHRIVRVNPEVLSGEQISVTLFEGARPIQIKRTNVYEMAGARYWSGTTPENIPMFVSTLTWDVDPSGVASPSNQNPQSPWRVDEQGVVTLDVRQGEAPGIAGPPPDTSEQKAEARRLQGLARRAFQSVTAQISAADGTRYVIKPLEYAPRYSLVYQVDQTKLLNEPIDYLAEDTRPEIEKRRAREYHEMVDRASSGLKQVRGELE